MVKAIIFVAIGVTAFFAGIICGYRDSEKQREEREAETKEHND